VASRFGREVVKAVAAILAARYACVFRANCFPLPCLEWPCSRAVGGSRSARSLRTAAASIQFGGAGQRGVIFYRSCWARASGTPKYRCGHILWARLRYGDRDVTAVALRKRFAPQPSCSRARALLHACFGLQFVWDLGAYWARLTSEKLDLRPSR